MYQQNQYVRILCANRCSVSNYPIGLTGIIGSGKSVVANYFAELGVDIVDTDQIAHNLTTANGAAIAAIRDEFGIEILLDDGSLDRQKMRQLVFKNNQAKDKLEHILHPLIYEVAVEQIKKSSSLYTIVVVPLLFKSPKYLELVIRSIFVDCESEDELIRRVMLRSNLTREIIQAIIHSHVAPATQLSLADDVIHNGVEVSQQELKQQVNNLHEYYIKIFK